MGIEVISAYLPQDEQITGESIKYSRSKTEDERRECLRIIKNCGGTRDSISTGYPVSTADDDKKQVVDAFRKKMKKIDQYHEKFQHMGLAIIIDIPLFLLYDPEWGKWLVEENRNEFEFVALIHWSGVDIYDFCTGGYSSKRIDREDMDALKKLGRMAAEGIIKDDNPAWQ